jgi:hypothetical protein
MGTSTSKATSSKKHRKATRSAFTVEGDQLTCGGLRITFQRTLRVSENGLNALPPGFGRFPLRPVRRSQAELAPAVVKRGGVMLPLYLREAMWLNFDSDEPVAVQIGAGGRCVVSGTPLKNKLRRKRQNYVVVPEQPWIDGFKTGDGEVRQFVGVAAGSGVSAEAQLTGSDTVGGIQIQVWHLTPEALERWRESQRRSYSHVKFRAAFASASPSMALGLGGRIQQEIYPDPFSPDDWQSEPTARTWVHLMGAAQWRACTGEVPPPTPITAESYVKAGLPWFDLYDADRGDLPTAEELRRLKSVGELSGEADDQPVVSPLGAGIVRLGRNRRSAKVRAGKWGWA